MSISQSHKSTPTKVTTKSLKTLSEIVKIPSNDQSLIGVILDATGNYKTDDSFDYVCKIKIIDKQFNPTKNTGTPDKVNPYVMIFIFTQKLKDSPVITKIGDIVLLRHFNFDTYQDIVKGIHKRNKSNWYIFDAQESSNNFTPITGSSLQNFIISADEKKRIKDMRQFSRHFFSNQNLLDLSWYKSKIPANIKTNTVYELKDIDLLVKVVTSVEFILDRNNYYKVAFVDQEKRIYLSELINIYGFKQLQKDTVLKLRSVRIQLVNNTYRIDFFDYSDILILPSHFLNAKMIQQQTKNVSYAESELENQFLQDFHLDKYDKQQIGQNTFIFKQSGQSNTNTLMQIKQTYGILEDFNIDTNLEIKDDSNIKDFYGSLIKKEHENLTYSSLKDLKKVLQQHKNSKNLGPQTDFEKVYRVKVNISKIKFTNYEDCIQMLCNKTQKIQRLNMKVKNKKDQKAILYNILSLQDTLSRTKMPVYIFSIDGNPNFIFDLWETLPNFSNIENFNEKNKNLKEFTKQLIRLQKSEQDFELCLQLLKTEAGNCFFRIIDSIFWFV